MVGIVLFYFILFIYFIIGFGIASGWQAGRVASW